MKDKFSAALNWIKDAYVAAVDFVDAHPHLMLWSLVAALFVVVFA